MYYIISITCNNHMTNQKCRETNYFRHNYYSWTTHFSSCLYLSTRMRRLIIKMIRILHQQQHFYYYFTLQQITAPLFNKVKQYVSRANLNLFRQPASTNCFIALPYFTKNQYLTIYTVIVDDSLKFKLLNAIQ